MPAQPSVASLQEYEKTRRHLRQARVALMAVLALGVPVLAWDLFHSVSDMRRPIESVPPNLSKLQEPMATIPPLVFSSALFTPPKAAQTSPAEGTAAVVAQVDWKVKGIVMGTNRRVLLEDLEGKQKVWVTEGQQLGPSKIIRIDERSVTLETNGATSELRM